MNQKTLVIVVVAVIVIAVVAAGVYLATQGGGGGGPTPTSTPTASPTVEGASSLQYSVQITGGSSAGTYKFMAKNIGQASMKIRVEISSGGVDLIYIVNGALQKAWSSMAGEWTESSSFSNEWDAWSSTFDGYKGKLADWSGTGEWTYTEDGTTVRVYDITINPTLADSLFEHS